MRAYKKPSINWIGKQIVAKGEQTNPYTIKSISKNDKGIFVLNIKNFGAMGQITLENMFKYYYWHRYKKYKGIHVVCTDICGIKEKL
jgi:hypothetical protein